MSFSGTGKGVPFAVNGGMQPFSAALQQWHQKKEYFLGI
jgi:hypothetical protein